MDRGVGIQPKNEILGLFLGKTCNDGSQKTSWHYDIGDENTIAWNISMQVAVRGPQTPESEVVLKGPENGVTLRDFWPNEQKGNQNHKALLEVEMPPERTMRTMTEIEVEPQEKYGC